MSGDRLPATLFADFTCPFCLVSEIGLARLAESRPLNLRLKAFELHPAPTTLPDPPQDPEDLARAAPIAAELGIELRLPSVRPRTRKAHEAARFAAEHGLATRMREALYVGYWSAGRDIGRIDVLMEIATETGLDPTDLKIALDIDRYREEVIAEEELARRLRVVRVPTLFVGSGPGARILEGARDLAALDEALAAR